MFLTHVCLEFTTYGRLRLENVNEEFFHLPVNNVYDFETQKEKKELLKIALLSVCQSGLFFSRTAEGIKLKKLLNNKADSPIAV